MEKLSVHQKSPKESKAIKRKQLKVVYISNPMWVETSAAEFKGRVQELTGRDSDVANWQSKLITDMERAEESPAAAYLRGSGDSTAYDSGACRLGVGGAEDERDHRRDPYNNGVGSTPFEMFDELFTPQMLENLAANMPSSLFYEPPPPPTAVDSFRRLDTA